MSYNTVAVKVAAPKEAEDNPKEPEDVGLFMKGSVSSVNGASYKNAASTLQRLFGADISKYHLLCALQRLRTGHAL